MAFAYEPKSKGDEEKAATAVRRLTEEDPTLDVHRDAADRRADHRRPDPDPRRGDRSTRMKSRFGAEIELHPPRVPYRETIRKPAKAHARYKKQTGGRGQFADCKIEIEPAEDGDGLRVRQRDQGRRRSPAASSPRSRRGSSRRWAGGVIAGYPIKDVRVRLFDGKHHDVDSSEMAFKIAGSMAFKQAMAEADPVPARADRAG